MEHLNFDQFISKYNELWDNCRDEFFKLEVLPEYDEFNIDDWSKVSVSQSQKLIQQVQRDIYSCKSDYTKKIAEQGMKFNRIRYVPYPITKYLLIEFSSYITSELIGANISMVDDAILDSLAVTNDPCFQDFLLFDDTSLLILDNPNGICKCSAYFTQDDNKIKPYIELKNSLKRA